MTKLNKCLYCILGCCFILLQACSKTIAIKPDEVAGKSKNDSPDASVLAVNTTSLLTEDFNYSAGQLTNVNSGANVSGGNWVNTATGTVVSPILVASGNLSFTGYTTSSSSSSRKILTKRLDDNQEDIARSFANVNKGAVYASFLINMTTADITHLANNTSNYDYFFGFLSTASSSNMLSRVYIRKGSVTGTINFGVSAASSTASAIAWGTVNYAAGTHLVTTGYQFIAGTGNDVCRIWVDQVISGNPPPALVKSVYTGETGAVTINRVAIRQQYGATPVSEIDGIKVYSVDNYSELWGINGESWDHARIPDFTFSGYKENKVALPNYATSVNVTTYGAVGNGITDCTAAFKMAIKNCAANGAVYIPAGTYLLTDTIQIKKSNIVLRGAGASTILYFNKGLEELYPRYNTSYPNQTSWSWSGGMILFKGAITNMGIENLEIKFPDNPYTGHDFHERGYNGIGFSTGASDGWIKNVTFTGVDVSVWIEKTAHHITVTDFVIKPGPTRSAQPYAGHHAVNIYGGYNLLQNFDIQGKYYHDLSVEGLNSMFNVFRAGKGLDLCIDHHNHAQSKNLFTNLDAGLGTRLYKSGGNDHPTGICHEETFWNITSAAASMPYCDFYNSSNGRSKNNVAIGIKTTRASELGNADGNWFESIDPLKLYPQDLYKAQMTFKGF